jgi:cytoskeleton protein RodZ
MMENQNNAEQVNPDTVTPSVSLGKILREAREHLGLSVGDVAGQIKFAPRQIEALESDDLKSLPEAAFVRGFVRSYAKILHLDADPLLEALPHANAATSELVPPSVEVPYPSGHLSQRQTLIMLGAALLLAMIAVGFSVWHYETPLIKSTGVKTETPVALPAETQVIPEPLVQEHETSPSKSTEPRKRTTVAEEQPSVRQTRAETAATAGQSTVTAGQSSVRAAKTKADAAVGQLSATVGQSSVRAAKIKADAMLGQTAATAGKSSVRATKTEAAQTMPAAVTADSVKIGDTATRTTTLRLVFDEESWTEITDKDGKMISSQINPRGSELNVRGNLPLSLVIGHAASAHLYKDGKPVDLTPYINATSEVARIIVE